MQLKAFTIPLHDTAQCLSDCAKQTTAATEEVNIFLRANRILSVDRHFVQDGANSIWAICVSYLEGANRAQAASSKRPKVDYREVLSEADFAIFANFYLDGCDRFLLEHCKVRGLVRYMDDIVWWADSKAAARETLEAATEFLRTRRQLETKLPVRIGRSALGLSFCGFRILPGAILLSRRRRQRYAAVRARWERAYSAGQIDALGLQAGYATALGMTAAADARTWRAEQLRRIPLGEEVAHV